MTTKSEFKAGITNSILLENKTEIHFREFMEKARRSKSHYNGGKQNFVRAYWLGRARGVQILMRKKG